MRLPAACAAVLALAGCFGHCEYTPTEATWTEPGLYAWLQVNGTSLFADWAPGDGALSFDGNLDGRPVPGRLVAFTAWQPDGNGLRLERDGWLVGHWPADAPDTQVRAGFLAFARNASAAAAPTLEAAADAFLASAHDAGFSEATAGPDGTTVERRFLARSSPLPGPLRLEAYANETGATWSDPAHRRPGEAVAAGGNLTWEFAVARWVVQAGDGTVTVDAMDRVLVQQRFEELDGDAEVARKVRDAFAEARLPPPALAGLQHSGYVC